MHILTVQPAFCVYMQQSIGVLVHSKVIYLEIKLYLLVVVGYSEILAVHK